MNPKPHRLHDLAKDTVAGAVASIAIVANIVSFGALMFPGALASGAPVAIWAMLIGSCIGGVWIALTTSLPPLATGIDSPTGAVLVLLSAAAGSGVLAAGGSAQSAVQTVMLVFCAATVLSGALLYGLGRARLGSMFRFVPSFVVGGFLAATGWFLLAGGLRMTTGRSLALASLAAPWSTAETIKLASAVVVLTVLLSLRHWVKSALALPLALVSMWAVGALMLRAHGLAGSGSGWYLPSLGALSAWSPFEAVRQSPLTWAMALRFVPEMLAVTVVALVSLVTKVASVEVARQAAGDLDREFRAHGVASLISAPFGGIASSLQISSSRLLEQAGGATRFSGVACALVLGAVGLASFDLPGLIPIPLIVGLIFYLGWNFGIDALYKPFAQRAWFDLLLTAAIMVMCVRYGYVVGVLGGIVCACLLFAVSYARIGAVRRHLTRAQFASYVNRSTPAQDHLAQHGDAIHLYWLAGYLFFGSSEAVFERVRREIDALPAGRVTDVVLDCALVSGADSSATISLTKLRNFCRQRHIELIYCALSPELHRVLQRAGFFTGRAGSHVFADRNLALAWSEDRLLARDGIDTEVGLAGFSAWLQQQLGSATLATDLMAYLKRQDYIDAQVMYRAGEPADNVDLVAAGSLAVDIPAGPGETLRVRTVMAHTVIGEMGFFRRAARSATVSSDGPATLYTLSRENFDRMRRERPDLAIDFHDFILRVMADRVTFSDRMAVALSH